MPSAPESITPAALLVEDASRRDRTKARVYVLAQLLGWGAFFTLNLFFTLTFPQPEDTRSRVTVVAALAMVSALGLLITHYSRRLFQRRGWKNLGWRALGSRLLATAAVQSLLWSGIGYGYTLALNRIFHSAWPYKTGPGVYFLISWVQGATLLCGWLCLYFFYQLADRFSRSEIERFRLATHVKDAELRALKSQVNPHFIFNALNSLRALIDEDPARAREAVTQLANLLRYSLQSGQLETVPFEDELRIVNDYLALEQVRHEERLRVRLDIDPATLTRPIPPLLLQTLVENAVKYGISNRPEGGEIAIVARLEGEALRLQVTNPGELSAAPKRSAGSTGVGLRNAAERLRLLFGERATLQVRAASPVQVVAEAVLPLEPSRS